MNQKQTESLRAVLTFADALGNKGTFSVPRAKVNLTEALAKASMLAIIASGALELKNMDPAVAAKSAKLVKTTRTVVVGS